MTTVTITAMVGKTEKLTDKTLAAYSTDITSNVWAGIIHLIKDQTNVRHRAQGNVLTITFYVLSYPLILDVFSLILR